MGTSQGPQDSYTLLLSPFSALKPTLIIPLDITVVFQAMTQTLHSQEKRMNNVTSFYERMRKAIMSLPLEVVLNKKRQTIQ